MLVDGNGTDRLQLTEIGVWPPVTVHEVSVGGVELGAAEWAAYPQLGVVRLTRWAGLSAFPRGVQKKNVTLLLSWGYEAVPDAVVLAQAKLAAAEVLGEAGGEAGGVTATRIGDYAVSYGREGRYAGTVGRLCEEAKEALAGFRVLRVRAV